MKNILLIGLCCFFVSWLNAQETWQIPGYTQHAALSVVDNGQVVKIVSGDQVATFVLQKKGTSLKLKNAADNQKILELLKVDTTAINSWYNDSSSGLLPAEKLVAKVNILPAKQVIITGEDSTDDIMDGGQETAGGIEGGQVDNNEDTGLTISWAYLVLSALALVMVTVLITRLLSRPQQRKQDVLPMGNNNDEMDRPAVTQDTKKLKQQLAVLQQQNQQLATEKAEAEKQLAAFQAFDKNYFSEAFQKLVAPMGAAIDGGVQVQVVENMMKIAAHFASLTRYKIAKKQNYDEANIRYMLNQKQPNDQRIAEISAATPLDKTPKNIQALINILKQYNSTGLDDSIISGYKIKNL